MLLVLHKSLQFCELLWACLAERTIPRSEYSVITTGASLGLDSDLRKRLLAVCRQLLFWYLRLPYLSTVNDWPPNMAAAINIPATMIPAPVLIFVCVHMVIISWLFEKSQENGILPMQKDCKIWRFLTVVTLYCYFLKGIYVQVFFCDISGKSQKTCLRTGSLSYLNIQQSLL